MATLPEMLNEAKTQYGVFSALRHKKFAAAFISAVVCYSVGLYEEDGTVRAHMFQYGTWALIAYIAAQGVVDAMAMWAFGYKKDAPPQ